MEGRTALIAAIVSGVLAVAIVAGDLHFGLEAEFQSLEDGSWVSLSDEQLYERSMHGCGSQEIRFEVHNNRLTSMNVPVSINYYTYAGESVQVLRETWNLERGEVKHFQFHVPDEAFDHPEGTVNGPKYSEHTLGINGMAGNEYLYTCVTPDSEAAA